MSMNSQVKTPAKKLNAKDRYRALTRDLDWDFSYADRKEAFPYEEFEGIKITDWSKWEDPFRLTMDAYWKYQAEKEKKLYAIFDAFAQNNGQMNVTNERYLNAIIDYIIYADVSMYNIPPMEVGDYREKLHPNPRNIQITKYFMLFK